MLRTRSIVSASMAAGLLMAGAHAQTQPGQPPDAATVPSAGDPPLPQAEDIVVRARYYWTKGPCIRTGGGWAMPALDAFEVVEVVSGAFRAKHLEVRFRTSGGPSYPRDLTRDKIYTLRLTPAEGTKRQLRENEKEGSSFLCVDGSELSEVKGEK